MNRFSMARALILRAKNRYGEIGDHGDPYEESLVMGYAVPELSISIKEIFEHLRSALDYCAREIFERIGLKSNNSQIYFPITSISFDSSNFPARANQMIPGILRSRPDIVDLLEKSQSFYSKDNEWLSYMATFVNFYKHEQLAIEMVSMADVKSHTDKDGKTYIEILDSDHIFYRKFPLMMIEGDFNSGNYRFKYVKFNSNDREILGFIEECIAGVEKIVNKIEQVL